MSQQSSRPDAPEWSQRDWIGALALIVALLLVYQPVWHAGFIWDDDAHVTANPCVIGPLGLKEIWTTSAAQYYPLVLTSFWFEHALWGLRPLPYHIVNVLMHAACAIVLWRLLLRLGVPGAWLGAALWAFHPVQVQSAAWVTEMKNTQSGFFYLLSIFFFAGWLKTRRDADGIQSRWNYPFSLLFAVLALTSKSSTVVLPMELCLVAWWIDRRWNWRSMAATLPVFFMAAVGAVMAIVTVRAQGMLTNVQWATTWPERFVISGKVFWFYLLKLVWLHPLVFVYPRWVIDAWDPLQWLPFLAAAALMALLWFNRQGWARPWFFALAYFLVALLPILGFVNHVYLQFSFVADHLQYLAGMGPMALAGAGITLATKGLGARKTWLLPAVGAVLLAGLGLVSSRQAWLYQDEERLWVDTIAQNPSCWAAHNNYGMLLARRGKVDDAIEQFKIATTVLPGYSRALDNWGKLLGFEGKLDEAIPLFREALETSASYTLAREDLAEGLMHQGKTDEAIDQFRQGLAITPDTFQLHADLADALKQKGQLEEAATEYRKAIDLNPTNAELQNSLGVVIAQRGDLATAIQHFQAALQLNPNAKNAQQNLAHAQAILAKAPAKN